MKYHIQFGSKKIDFTLKYQERRSLSIQVLPDTTVEVLAPQKVEMPVVLNKVKIKAPWILKQISYFNSFQPLTTPRRYISGETHLYLGRQHKLKVMQADIEAIKVYRGQMWLYSRNIAAGTLREKLDDWYRQRARLIFREILNELLTKFERYHITMPSLIVRKMSKRWGSCTAAGNIILNIELIKASKGCIEYVVTHELCHLVYRSHNKDFFRLLNRLLPDWEKRKNRLERMLA